MEQALALIAAAKETRATCLDLGNCGLTELPEALFELEWLEELVLSDEWLEYDFEKLEWKRSSSQNTGASNQIYYLPTAMEGLVQLKKLIVAGTFEDKWNLEGLLRLNRLKQLQYLDISNTQTSDLNPIKGLSQLQSLDISNTQISDLNPIKDLKQLQQLCIFNTQISDLSPIKDLSQLQLLYIFNTQISDLNPIKDLTQLQQLWVASTQISDLNPIKDLKQLQSLDISITQISDLNPIKDLNQLQSLNIFNMQISDLSPIKDLKELQYLYISNTQVSDLNYIKGLTQLQELDISNTQINNLNPIKDLKQLQYLNISNTQVSDLNPIKDLKQLQQLGISNKQINYLNSIIGLTQLQELDISNTQINDLNPIKGLIQLQELDISNTQINDLNPIKGLIQLQELNISYTQVSDLNPIKDLKQLQRLGISNTQINDLNSIKGLTQLQELDISNTQVSDLNPIIGLTQLQELDISNTQVSDLNPIIGLTQLQELDISNTQVSDLNPIKDLKQLQRLGISNKQINDLNSIKGLTQLQELDISNTQVSDLNPIIGLTQLQELDISNTQVSDLNLIKDLSQLQSLNISNTQISDLNPIKDLKQLQSLNISNTQISDLNLIKDLSQLQSLNISNTQISDLNPIKDLNLLQYLDFSNTQISDLNPIKDLKQLQRLGISNTQISDLNPIKDLKQLQRLGISNTQISDLHPIKGLSQLQSLDISNTQISDLNPIKDLKQLQYLYFSNTQISDLNPIKDLKQLQYLYFSNTQISDLNPIKDLKQLQYLYIPNTKVSDLSPVKGLSQIEILSAHGCPIQNIPIEIYNQRNCAKDLISYWKILDKAQITENKQLKVMFLGNGCVGKSTLLHWFINNHFTPISLEEGRTHGIFIKPYFFEKNGILSHFWDFGGQEVFHATHRLFLGSRTLYVLVWTTQSLEPNGDTAHPPQYWLDLIADIAEPKKPSRVLLVQNLFEGQQERNILSDTERLDYENKGLEIRTYCASFKEESDVAVLKAAIEAGIKEQIRRNREELPDSWVYVREAVAQRRREGDKMLSQFDFTDICHHYGLYDHLPTLLKYLHRAGELFYYPDRFENKIVLDQEWALRAVYAILKREKIERFNGRIRKSELLEMWRNDGMIKQQEEADIFINFIIASRIAFFTEQKHWELENPELVIPQLLPTKPPKRHETWKKLPDKIRHRLVYQFLHRDIIERFIVQTAHLSKDKTEDIWRDGLFIEHGHDDEALIEVIIMDDVRQIQIECAGAGKKELLQKIREEFHKIRSLEKAQEFHTNEDEWVLFDEKIQLKDGKPGGFEPPEPAPAFTAKHIQIILECLEENRVEDALRLLPNESEFLWKVDIKRRLKHVNDDYHSNTITPDDFRRELSKITNDIQQHLSQWMHTAGLQDERFRQPTLMKRPEIPTETLYSFNPTINLTIQNTNQNDNKNTHIQKTDPALSKDIAELKNLLTQLHTDTQNRLKEFIESLPEPENEQEKQSTGHQILRWLNKNAEGITVNAAASVYYDAFKFLFGIG